MYVLFGEEELVSEVGHHASELAVDEVERTAEVLGAHAHEGLHHIHFRFASATGDNPAVQLCHEFPVGIIAAVEVPDYRFSVHPQSREDERCTPTCSVLALEAMPEHRAFGCLNDEAEESGVLELGVLAANERRVHVRCHRLYLGIERIIDNMVLEVEKRFLRNSRTADFFFAQVDRRQEMVRCACYFAIRQEFGLGQRTEIEDTAEVIIVSQAPYVLVRSIVQVSSTQQQAAT